MMIITLVSILVGWQTGSVSAPKPLLGAEMVMRRLAAPRPKGPVSDPVDQLQGESDALHARLPNLLPNQAAEQWVALMQKWETALSKRPNTGANADDGWDRVMMTALPEPKIWPLIRDRLAKLPQNPKHRAAIGLFDDLLGRDAAVLRDLESKRNPDADPQKEDTFSPDHEISQAEQPIALRAGNLDLLSKVYLRRVGGDMFMPWEGIPDIVRQFGRRRAVPILREMLESVKRPLDQFNGFESQNLARSIVLSDLAKLKVPAWGLVRGVDDFPFVSAQVIHFGVDTFKTNGSLNNADIIYALGLARSGNADRAIELLSTASGWSGDLAAFVKPGPDQQALFSLVASLLDRKPIDSLWQLYSELGISLGHSNDVAKRLDAWLSDPGLLPESRAKYLGWKADRELAGGNLRSGISGYEECIRLSSANYPDKLLRLAGVTGDKNALDMVAQAAKTMGTRGSQLPLVEAYIDQGRIADAQAAVLLAAQDVHNVNLRAEGQGRLLDALPDIGVDLAELFYISNQPGEIVTLLHEYPSWGAGEGRVMRTL